MRIAPSTRRWVRRLAGAALALSLVAILGLRAAAALRRRSALAELERSTPGRSIGAEHLSSDACHACHPGEHESWHSTFHRTMTQVPQDENVLGDFDGVQLEYFGRTFTLERDVDGVWVRS